MTDWTIREAHTAAELDGAAQALRELRPLLSFETIRESISRTRESGARILIAAREDQVLGSAGFRTGENMAWGRFLYVDDLVVVSAERSRGIGAALLAALRDEARRLGCAELHLDTNVTRAGAHRFYEREGLEWTSRHYRERLGGR